MKLFYYIIFGLLILSSFLADYVNLNYIYIYFSLIFFITLYFLIKKDINILREKISFILLITLLAAIDKINDFTYNYDFTQIFPLIYVILVVLFLQGIKVEKCDIWNILRNISLVGIIISIFYSLFNNIDFDILNRDTAALTFFYAGIYFYSNKKGKYIIFLLAMMIGVFYLTSRTLIISFSTFLFIHFTFMHRIKKHIFFIFLITTFIFSFLIIYLGVLMEYKITQSGYTIFSGHGLLWGAFLEDLFSSPLREILLGKSTTQLSLTNSFSNIYNSVTDSTLNILISGHTHNGIVYTLYNTGVIGIICLYKIILTCIKSIKYNLQNINLFFGIFIFWFFNGRGLTSIYLVSTLLLITLIIPINNNQKKTH